MTRVLNLIMCCLLPTGLAWGPARFKQKHSLLDATTRLMSKNNRDDGDESIIIESFRAQLLTSQDSLPLNFNNDPASGMSAMEFVKGRADELAAEAFATDGGLFGENLFDTCGDECDEECPIPDEWKIVDEEKFDVMNFLGIKRAEPLRKVSDWE